MSGGRRHTWRGRVTCGWLMGESAQKHPDARLSAHKERLYLAGTYSSQSGEEPVWVRMQFIDSRKQIQLRNGCTFHPKHFVYYRIPEIIYLLQYKCGCFYFGKAFQEFWRCIYRHVHSMWQSDPEQPLGRHVGLVHAGSFPGVSFLVLDWIHQNPQGGDLNKLIKWELQWISDIHAFKPPGLNEAFNFKPFLKGFTSGSFEKDLWAVPPPGHIGLFIGTCIFEVSVSGSPLFMLFIWSKMSHSW